MNNSNETTQNPRSVDLVSVAFFAAEKHKGQRRKNVEKTPYINHPLEVAHFLLEANVEDPVPLAVAMLHDTVEDTDTTLSEIEGLFGHEVASAVAEVTDDKSLPKVMRKKLQVQKAKGKSRAAKLVKLGDKLSNLQSIQQDPPAHWSKEEQYGYVVWCLTVVRELLGTCEELEAELESVFSSWDLSLYEDPVKYAEDLHAYYTHVESQS